MKEIWSVLLALLLFVSVVGAATPVAENGSVTVEDGTINIDSHTQGDDDLELTLNESDNIHYTENEDWNETYSVISPETHQMVFTDSSEGQSGEWLESNIQASATEGVDVSRIDIFEDNETYTHIGLNTIREENSTGTEVISLDSDNLNSFSVSHTVDELHMRAIDIDNNTQIGWSTSEASTIQVRDLSSNTPLHLRNQDNEVIAAGVSDGNFEFTARGDTTATFHHGSTLEVGQFEVDPIWTHKTVQNGEYTVTYTVTNTGDESADIEMDPSAEWITTNETTRSVVENGSTEFELTINSTKLVESFDRSDITFSSGSEQGSVYLEAERDDSGGTDEFTLPVFGAVNPWFVVIPFVIGLSLIGPVAWTLWKDDETDNVFV